MFLKYTEATRYHFPGSASKCIACQHIRNAAYKKCKAARTQQED